MTKREEKRFGLTKKQVDFMKLTLNYDERKVQHSDNYSNAGIEEGMEAFGWSAYQMGGLISSLKEKGMGYLERIKIDRRELEKGEKPEFTKFWLTELGVNAIFEVIEAETKELEE